mgnify:CR=1 FL=1
MTDSSEARTDALPFFLTVEWIKQNINLTPKDRRELSDQILQQRDDWPNEKLDEGDFARAYQDAASQDIWFPGFVERLINRKHPTKAHRKGISGSIVKRVLNTLDPANREHVQHSWDITFVRNALYQQGELSLLAELLWIQVCEGTEIKDAVQWIEKYDRIYSVLENFFLAFSESTANYEEYNNQYINESTGTDMFDSASKWPDVMGDLARLMGEDSPGAPDPEHARALLRSVERLVEIADEHAEHERSREAEKVRERACEATEHIDQILASLPSRKHIQRISHLRDALEAAGAAIGARDGLDAETAQSINQGLTRTERFVAKVSEAVQENREAARAYHINEDAADEDIEQRLDDTSAHRHAIGGRIPEEVVALHDVLPDAGALEATEGSAVDARDAEAATTPERGYADEDTGRGSDPAAADVFEADDSAAAQIRATDDDAEVLQEVAGATHAAPWEHSDARDAVTDTAKVVHETGGDEHLAPTGDEAEYDDRAQTGGDDLDANVPAVLGTLATRHEFSLAYHLTICASYLDVARDRMPLPATLELFNTGRTVRSSGGQAALACWPLAQRLSGELAGVDRDKEQGLASIAFTFAGCLRPALFAPDSGARQLLQELEIGQHLQFLHPVREAINELDRRNVYTTASRLRGADDTQPAREAYKATLKDLSVWLEQTRNSTIVYAPATKVWRSLVMPEGRIGSVIEAICAEQGDARARARNLICELSDDEAVERFVQETDDELRQGSTRNPIHARAMGKLQINARTAADKINHWLEGVASLDDAQRGVEDRAHHKYLLDSIQDADAQAAELGQSGSPIAAAAAAGLRQVFSTLQRLMSNADDLAPVTHQFALHADVLKLPGMRYVGGWSPKPYEFDTILVAITDAADRDRVDWVQAFRDRLAEANHLATARIIEIVRRLPDCPADPNEMAHEREQAVAQARARLHERRDQIRRDLDRAMRLDQSEDMQLSDWIDYIDAVDPDALPQEERLRDDENASADRIADFPAALRLLEDAKNTISRTDEEARRVYLTRIEALESESGVAAQQSLRLRALLGQGDLLTLAEYLETAERGSLLPEVEDQGDVFDALFPGFVRALDKEVHAFAQLKKAADEGKDAGSVTFGRLSEDRRDDAVQMMAHWASLKKNALRANANPKETLAQLFEAFGFRDVTLEEEKGSKSAGRTRRFTLKTQTLADQTICPVPAFGSNAGGHYELMIYAGQASVDEIIRDAGGAGRQPRIAIILGRMSEAQRRTFAHQAHEQRRSVLLIDEVLLLFLALHEGYRLAALFAASLPFAWSAPYTTTAGNIPIEIFYGRTQEIEKIRDPEGPSLVFGGRQLGKSALLQHVAKLDHAPKRGHVVRVLDCRQIGRSEPASAIWPRISNDLATLSVVDGKLTDGHEIADQIMKWLDGDRRRRVLICLDEMDYFMLSEVESDYKHLVIMKELMQRSNWRCKFVFAGLHDIQRMAKTVNTPLAHLGEPICVGPLYGDDLAAAHRLVTQPMAAAGYCFESEALALRILADVLYYPSLVQVYCKQMLEQLREMQFSEHEGPRYTITKAMVERAFAGEQLRDQLAQRFDLTLRLDPRYRLIALILTQHAFEGRNRYVEGYSLQWIRDEALHWWPQGFPSTSNDAFRTLLDEMQGLGILYKRNTGWRLRSTKIASMIGSPERVDQDLVEFENTGAELIRHEPAVYHRSSANNPFRPSPLTQSQEHDMVDNKSGVSIIFGARLHGIDEVIPAAKSTDPPMTIRPLAPTSNIRSFGNAINNAEEQRGTPVLVIGSEQPWNVEWVRGALRHRAIRARKVRLIFVGGSEAALNWAESGLETEEGRKLQVLPLRPWTDQGLKLWLHDVTLDTVDTPDDRTRILEETGGYTRLVASFGEHLYNLPRDWRHRREHWFEDVGRPQATHEALGILPQMAPLVYALADFGKTALNRDDVGELPSLYGFDMPVSVDVALSWAEMLGFITACGRARWQINPLLTRVLANIPKSA